MLYEKRGETGTLAGDPSIASAEGHDLIRDMPGAFAAMAKKCGSATPIILGSETRGESYAVICPKPFPPERRFILGETGCLRLARPAGAIA